MRLAEMQLKIVWEEILKRFPVIEIVEPPERARSCFLRSYRKMMVRIPARA
jgi:cytochrome P450